MFKYIINTIYFHFNNISKNAFENNNYTACKGDVKIDKQDCLNFEVDGLDIVLIYTSFRGFGSFLFHEIMSYENYVFYVSMWLISFIRASYSARGTKKDKNQISCISLN